MQLVSSSILRKIDNVLTDGYKVFVFSTEESISLKMIEKILENDSKVYLIVPESFNCGNFPISNFEVFSIDEMEYLSNVVRLYEFSDKIIFFSDDSVYPGIRNYVNQGILTEKEMVEALLYL